LPARVKHGKSLLVIQAAATRWEYAVKNESAESVTALT
jgi:hypothetical protein